jgi:hypothetical protein
MGNRSQRVKARLKRVDEKTLASAQQEWRLLQDALTAAEDREAREQARYGLDEAELRRKYGLDGGAPTPVTIPGGQG